MVEEVVELLRIDCMDKSLRGSIDATFLGAVSQE